MPLPEPGKKPAKPPKANEYGPEAVLGDSKMPVRSSNWGGITGRTGLSSIHVTLDGQDSCSGRWHSKSSSFEKDCDFLIYCWMCRMDLSCPL